MWVLANVSAYKAGKANQVMEDQLKVTQAELDEALGLLRELNDAERNGNVAQVRERVATTLARPDAVKLQADLLVSRIDELMKQGEKIAAVGFIRQETGAVWDHIHEVVGSWKSMLPPQRHEVVSRFLRKKQLAI
jgi:hypothetical protein